MENANYNVSYCSEVTAEPVYGFSTWEEADKKARELIEDHITRTTQDEYKKSIKANACVIVEAAMGVLNAYYFCYNDEGERSVIKK